MAKHISQHTHDVRLTEVAGYVSRNILLSFVAVGLLLVAEVFGGEYRRLFTVSGIVAGLLAILLTYSVGGRLWFTHNWTFFQPLRGGARFVVFQIIGWTFFAFTISLPWVPWLIAWRFPTEAATALILCAGASSLVGEIMMVCSLLTYSRPDTTPTSTSTTIAAAKKKIHGSPSSTSTSTSTSSTPVKEFLLSRRGHRMWTAFLGLQALLSVFACVLAVLAEHYVATEFARLILTFFAVICFSLSLFLAYGIGGRWKYYTTDWKFYQPFSGGKLFIALQALAWAFFSISMLVFLLDMIAMAGTLVGFHRNDIFPVDWVLYLPSFITASICGVIAQGCNAASLFFYKEPMQTDTNKSVRIAIRPILAAMRQVCFVVFMFNLEKAFAAAMLLSFILADQFPHTVVGVWVVVTLLYLPTFQGHPSRTGRRAISSLRPHWLFDEMASYFRLSIKPQAPLPPENKYILGFHPHGILPITCGWVHFTTLWQATLPGITPASLTSTVLHYVPIMRDVCQVLGGMEVTREGFRNALQLFGSVIFVPGGQKEMLESRSEDRNVVVSTEHTGFIRLAMKLAAESPDRDIYLVPVYSFGETQLLDNLRLPLVLQRWCIRMLRANVVFFPYGMLGLPGVPRPEKLTIALGKPVLVPRVSLPSEEQMKLVHRRFYTELEHAFSAEKENAGHGDDTLKYVPAVEPLSQEQYDVMWEELNKREDHTRRPDRTHNSHESKWVALTLFLAFLYVVYKAYW